MTELALTSPRVLSSRRVLSGALAVGALAAIPTIASPFQTITICYGLVFAIAALGFNLLLGYTGLLSFGHSAYFGTGAYVVALLVKYLGVASMELFVVAGILSLTFVKLYVPETKGRTLETLEAELRARFS